MRSRMADKLVMNATSGAFYRGLFVGIVIGLVIGFLIALKSGINLPIIK